MPESRQMRGLREIPHSGTFQLCHPWVPFGFAEPWFPQPQEASWSGRAGHPAGTSCTVNRDLDAWHQLHE